MADIDCHSDMQGFHADKVTLGNNQQAEMRSRRDAGRTRLENGLARAGHPKPRETQSQGSYAMRTMVQDDDNEYDIDDGVYFAKDDLVDADGDALEPAAARQRVRSALKDDRLKYDAFVKSNCVRQEYPEGYHIDIPVYRVVAIENDDGEAIEQYELASGDRWSISDARAVTAWFNSRVGELNRGASDGSQLRRVTKLTKKFARRREWKAQTTSGICITRLVWDHFVQCDARDDKALRETWRAVAAALAISTEIAHPVLDGNLAERGDRQVAWFASCLQEALQNLEVLDDEDCTQAKARAAWDAVFATTYFGDLPSDGDGGDGGAGGSRKDSCGASRVALVSTGTTPARRNDNGGRFG